MPWKPGVHYSQRNSTPVADSIDRSQLLELIDALGAQVVDVLPKHEYAESHLPDAISIPLKVLTASSVSGLDPDRPVVVYCHDSL